MEFELKWSPDMELRRRLRRAEATTEVMMMRTMMMNTKLLLWANLLSYAPGAQGRVILGAAS